MKSDVVVIGGGAIGSSVAYHLKSDPAFSGTVTVVERDPAYSRASSALSASSIRQQFSTPLNIHLSRFGIGFLRRARDLLGVDLGLREPGYLFLASPAGEAVLRANHGVQKGEGCAVELLDPAALKTRFPWISEDGLVLASHGTANEGWFDGPSLMQGFRRTARDLGATYIADEVVSFDDGGVDLLADALGGAVAGPGLGGRDVRVGDQVHVGPGDPGAVGREDHRPVHLGQLREPLGRELGVDEKAARIAISEIAAD